MNIRIAARASVRNPLTTLASLTLCLSACNGQLDVVDAIDTQGRPIEAGPVVEPEQPPAPPEVPVFEPSGPLNVDCRCASSPGLQPLLCDGHAVPLLDNDVIQLTTDGSLVAFNIGIESFPFTSPDEVAYWDGAETRTVSRGMLLGLSASGQRLLVAGADPVFNTTALHLATGLQRPLTPQMIVGRGALSASGELALGTVFEDDVSQLALANTDTGAVELLGEIYPIIARAYVSPDASAIVGFASADLEDGSAWDSFRWTRSGGITYNFTGAAPGSTVWPEALSSDGTIVAGRADGFHFRWSEAQGFEQLASASGRSEAYISADGNVVLGSLDPEGVNDSSAFRWTRETGAVDITPGRASLATDMSDDGNVIVANSWEEAQIDGDRPEATYIWDAVNGTRTLVELLAERNVDTTGWRFAHARVLSGDGKVLLGLGSCGSVPTLYRVVLSD